MADPHLKSFDDLFPSAFWMCQNPSVENYAELKYVVAAFKLWAQAQPSMPRTVSGNTELFEAFKRGWLEEKNRAPDHPRIAVHADGGRCHGMGLVNGRCPGCGISPDTQSVEIWDSHLVRKV